MTYDELIAGKEQELKPLLDRQFLSTLVEAARVCGHSVDYVELVSFVGWCYGLLGKEPPDLTPYGSALLPA
jgi:hypothetical protein